MESKIIEIGYGWKVRMKYTNNGWFEFSKYRNKSHPLANKNQYEHDCVQIFDDEESKALTEFWKFIEKIQKTKR